MIEIEKTEIVGWDAAIRGMRNPKNSWDKSDSTIYTYRHDLTLEISTAMDELGPNDLKLAKTLANAGTDHGKFLRFIVVYVDITAPLYWWKEFDTYKVGTVRDSCSTMHKIHAKPFELTDFSWEHLYCPSNDSLDILKTTIGCLNHYRKEYIETKDKNNWWQLIQLLPSSYNQRSTVMLNYAVLRNMYHARKNHKLDEWRSFCHWVETLPYAKELIIGE